MKLYQVAPDERFESVVPVDRSEWDRFCMLDGTTQRKSWVPILVRRVAEDEGRHFETADFPWLGSHVLVMRRRATEVLAELLNEYGELLPLECADAELWAYNVCRVVDALDEERAKIARFPGTGRIMSVERYAFRPEQVDGHLLFKLRQLPLGPIVVSDAFVQLVRSRQLVGLDFQAIWEGVALSH